MIEIKPPSLKIPEDSRGECIGMCFILPDGEDRQALVIKTLTDIGVQRGSDFDKHPAVVLTMPCGEVVTYEKFVDVPIMNVACSCGDPKHFFIKWYKS